MSCTIVSTVFLRKTPNATFTKTKRALVLVQRLLINNNATRALATRDVTQAHVTSSLTRVPLGIPPTHAREQVRSTD